MHNKIPIGTLTNAEGNYSAKRNVIDLPYQHYTHKKVFSWYRIPSFLHYKLLKKAHLRWEFLANDMLLNSDVKLLHFFNAVSNGSKPWITSFESYVPYWELSPGYANDLKLLLKDSCKKIIPISLYAKNICRANVEKSNPSLWADIEKKMLVLQPGQRLVLDNISNKPTNPNHLQVAIVGSFFFNKGGKAIVQAAKRLIDEGYPLQLHIVSSMTYNVWNMTKATASDYASVMRTIKNYSQHIFYYPKLQNDKVLELMKSTDIGLLPSLGDTYGYSVLEFMSAGCPVITTTAFAFEEFNSSEKGWLIDIRKDQINNPILNTQAEIDQALNKIEEELYSILKSAFFDKERLKQLSQKAFAYVAENHSPEKCAAVIESIYNSILN